MRFYQDKNIYIPTNVVYNQKNIGQLFGKSRLSNVVKGLKGQCSISYNNIYKKKCI